MDIFFSHTGNHTFFPEIKINKPMTTLGEVIDYINQIQEYNGIKNYISLNGKVKSSVRVFKNIDVDIKIIQGVSTRRYYETEVTKEITSLDCFITQDTENILITMFDPHSLLELINQSQTFQEEMLSYVEILGKEKRKKYNPIISNINFDLDVEEEVIYGFKNGESTLESLKIPSGGKAYISFKEDNFDKENSKLLSEDLVDAIRDIWELPSGKGNLRLFQEDSLFFIMSRLMNTEIPIEKQLLLSMPTGGGKTEAFMIPLLAHIYQEKINKCEESIKSIIIYPTNALANDQAMRFVELIYKINRKLFERGVHKSNYISIGILSGDTPSNYKIQDLENESLIKICPNCGKSDKWKVEDGTLICKNILSSGQMCGTRLDFCRLTKEDIVNNPPDILITNPDEINISLHSPKYSTIFHNKIGSIVFDEIHIYQGVFGCHIAHLLRRLEEMMLHKPLYIGMSATIGNAKELAALLFDEPLANINYIKNENSKYLTDKIEKKRYHALVRPYLRKSEKNRNGNVRNKYVRTISVAGSIGLFIGHLITDSHFRKSIIFTNYRSDADDMAGYIRERERLDVKQYFDEILLKLQTNKQLSKEEVEICQFMNLWFSKIIKETKTINPKVEIGWNRGGLEKEERIRSIHSFSRNNILSDEDNDDSLPIDVMVATKSLEVGIDIGDVTTVINSSAPFTTNEYVQRVGRGGRKKDSLAITVINPENAIDAHLSKHFKEYVFAKADSFEDAPIIINNNIIVERHIKARIIDYYTSQYLKSPNCDNNVFLSVGDILQKVKVIKDGNLLTIGEGVTVEKVIEYADAIYDDIFYKKINGIKVEDRFIEYLQREEKILNTKKSELTSENFREWIRSVIKEINNHTEGHSQDKWEMHRKITGYDAVMPSLTPALRGSGATVGLYIGDSKKPIDTVTRQSAFNSMPLAVDKAVSSTKSGISSFRIIDNKGESDTDVESKLKCIILKNEIIAKYFNRKLEKFPYSDDFYEFASSFHVEIPLKLNVSYFPSRFYCINCEIALTPEDYSSNKTGVYCKKCGHKVQQLHKIYMCEDDECGNLFDPPAPKICMNPECRSVKKAFQIYKENGNKYKVEMINLFKFRLTRNLEWVCKSCGFKADYSSFQNMIINNQRNIVDNIISIKKDDKKTIEGMCYRSKYFPEVLNFNNPNKSRFRCTTLNHKNIKSVGVPRVRTIAYNYIGNTEINGTSIELCTPVITPQVKIDFNEGYVIQLANEFMRRFSFGTGEKEVFTLKTEKIFEKKYWGNFYESHLAWIKFGKVLDDFINLKAYTCDGNCTMCSKFDELALGKMMKPVRNLEDYNYDAVNNRPKKPDYRSRYCDVAKENKCTSQSCEICEEQKICDNFSKDKFLRYLIVHTIKHGILWSLPKYAGVNVSEIRGEIYPNDYENNQDLVLIDSNEGGSGAIPLIKKHWNEIWEFAKEIIKLTTINEANIILPHTCSRYNSDICPFIADEFMDFFKI